MATLLIGIGIGLSLGVIIMILSKPGTDTMEAPDMEGEDENYGEGLGSAAFIEIDFDQLEAMEDPENTNSLYGLKRKLARFKLRNRFYS